MQIEGKNGINPQNKKRAHLEAKSLKECLFAKMISIQD